MKTYSVSILHKTGRVVRPYIFNVEASNEKDAENEVMSKVKALNLKGSLSVDFVEEI